MLRRARLAAFSTDGPRSSMAFFCAPIGADSASIPTASRTDGWFSQKIFYFHVPVAEASFLVFVVAAFFGDPVPDDARPRATTPSRASRWRSRSLFVMLTMVTGDLWTKASWGVWWEWEPRLTTYFIMTLLVIAYFVLRNSVEDEERRAVYAAVFGIIAFIDAPISFFITRSSRVDPPGRVRWRRGLGLEPPMLVTFIVAQIGMLMIGYAIYQLRLREEERQGAHRSAQDRNRRVATMTDIVLDRRAAGAVRDRRVRAPLGRARRLRRHGVQPPAPHSRRRSPSLEESLERRRTRRRRCYVATELAVISVLVRHRRSTSPRRCSTPTSS